MPQEFPSRPSRFRTHVGERLAIILIITIFIPPSSAAETIDCPGDPVVTRVEAASVYSDSQGSIVDPEKLKQSLDLIAPLRKFVTDASLRADSPDHTQQDCAFRMMLGWARGGSMLEEPADFAGQRERERFTIALNIIALKLRSDGFDIAPLLGWLGELNRGVSDDFEKRNRVDNLYIWSGVAAASYAVLNGNAVAQGYADKVWDQGIAAIRPDGYVDSELRRASRAMLYHEYYVSALLTLHAFRKALGEAMTPMEHAGLKLLIDRIAGSYCDPSAMVSTAGGYPQEKIPLLQLSPAVAFGKNLDFSDPLFGACAPQGIPVLDPILGGNFDKTANILSNLRRSEHVR